MRIDQFLAKIGLTRLVDIFHKEEIYDVNTLVSFMSFYVS